MDSLESYLKQGEGISLEFKRCGNKPEMDIFETICAFANRQGGSLLLGVLDDGTIEGIRKSDALPIERSIVNVLNNPKLFNTAPLTEFERLLVSDERCVLRVWVPMGPSTYRFKGEVYDRMADADIRLRSEAQINALSLRKQRFYTEAEVIPWVAEDDLRLDLLERARTMAANARPGHPWPKLSNEELFRSSRLYTRDGTTGTWGFTLAAVLLLGKEETILSVCPAYRTDAFVRREDLDRYDDRIVVRKNLIEAYDDLSGFCAKWLPDPFVLEGYTRISMRSIIVRELIVNSLAHREYTSPYTAQIEIGTDYLCTRNASRSLFSTRITPENLCPISKNPIIADFFTQLGWAEELGSGTRKLFKYSKLYSGQEPVLVDGDFFEARVPIPGLGMSGRSAVRLPVRTPSKSDETSFRVIDAIRALQKEGVETTTAQIALKANLSERTTRRHLAQLVESRRVARAKKGRSTTYVLANDIPLGERPY